MSADTGRRFKYAREEGITATDLAFGIGPKLNARGRLDEAMAGVRFLVAPDRATASELLGLLERENEERKRIEGELKIEAMAEAERQVADGVAALVVWLPQGHAGVHGIVASRVTEAYGRPTVCLSPKQDRSDLATGSARGIDGFHVRDALQRCTDNRPELLTAFGGHEGAGGLTLPMEQIGAFREKFQEAAAEQLDPGILRPVIVTDGMLEPEALALDTVDALTALEPFGRGFEAPVFEGRFRVAALDRVGDGTHVRLALQCEGTPAQVVPAIWFGAVESGADPVPIAQGQWVHAAFELAANEYRERHLQLRVRHLVPVADQDHSAGQSR